MPKRAPWVYPKAWSSSTIKSYHRLSYLLYVCGLSLETARQMAYYLCENTVQNCAAELKELYLLTVNGEGT